MGFFDDDACPFDWAEYNLPAELLSQAGTMLAAFSASATAPKAHLAMQFFPHDAPPAEERPADR